MYPTEQSLLCYKIGIHSLTDIEFNVKHFNKTGAVNAFSETFFFCEG